MEPLGTIIVVDVQSFYEKYIPFNVGAMIAYIDNALTTNLCRDVLFLYNDEQVAIDEDEESLRAWYSEKWSEYTGIFDEAPDVLYEAGYLGKGYGFFRDCMDEGYIDELVPIIKHMWKMSIRDSRFMDLDDPDFPEIPDSLKDLVDSGLSILIITELMDILAKMRGKVTLMGGGRQECLNEVTLAVRALDLEYDIDYRFVYP